VVSGSFQTDRDADEASKSGAWFGGLFGVFVGAGFLILPGLGAVVVAGPIVAGFEGAIAGTALGSLAGVLVGWDVPKDRALHDEKQVKGDKFPVVVRSEPEVVARARALLTPHSPGHIEVFEPHAS
jgi:hypothetical protein